MKIPDFYSEKELTDWVGWHIEPKLRDQILEFLELAQGRAYEDGYCNGYAAAKEESQSKIQVDWGTQAELYKGEFPIF